MNRQQYIESLAAQGMRVASQDENGWADYYHDDARGEKVATWITDAPAKVEAAKVAQIAASVGCAESQVQDIIDFENAQQEQAQLATQDVTLPGFDWDWVLDALLKSADNGEYARLAKHIYNNVNPLARRPQCVQLTSGEIETIISALTAYLPWETPEVRLDLQELINDIRQQVAEKVQS